MKQKLHSIIAAGLIAPISAVPTFASNWNTLATYAHPQENKVSVRYEGGTQHGTKVHTYSFFDVAKQDGKNSGYFESRIGYKVADIGKLSVSAIVEGDVGTQFDERTRAGIIAKGSLWNGNYSIIKALPLNSKVADPQYTLSVAQRLTPTLNVEARVVDYSPKTNTGLFQLELAHKINAKGNVEAVVQGRYFGKPTNMQLKPAMGVRYNF